ncbi:MAG: preprotein translocase subunit SecE [Frankiales bacterium]|nr:preprotein translocase subunit SecE [Frankiales bacterium]
MPGDETRQAVNDSRGTAAGLGGLGDDGRDVEPDDDTGAAAAAVPAGAYSARAGGVGRVRSIGVFYRQVVAELRKVIWPTRKELVTYTSVVVVFVIIMALFVAAFDFAFGQAVLAVFGE